MQIQTVHSIVLSNDGKPASRDMLYNQSEKLVIKTHWDHVISSLQMEGFVPCNNNLILHLSLLTFCAKSILQGHVLLRLGMEFYQSGNYTVKCFIHNIFISLKNKKKSAHCPTESMFTSSALSCCRWEAADRVWRLAIICQQNRMGKTREIAIIPCCYTLKLGCNIQPGLLHITLV